MNVSGVLGPILYTLLLWEIFAFKVKVNKEQKNHSIELSKRILTINRKINWVFDRFSTAVIGKILTAI